MSALFAVLGTISMLAMVFAGGGIESGILAIFFILVAILTDNKPTEKVFIPGPGDLKQR